MTNEMSMQPTIIKIARKPDRPDAPEAYPGWIVPDTDGLLAIDERYAADLEFGEPAWWTITHIPTGFRVTKGGYTDANTREAAIAIAQRFFREYKARGWTLDTNDPAEVIKPHNSMNIDEKNAFWRAVANV